MIGDALFLDTTVLVDALRDRGSASRLRAAAERRIAAFVCAINVEEIWRGSRRRAEDLKIAELLRALRVVPLGQDEGERAGRWRREFAARGVTLGQADCLIAAAAFSIGATLVTANVKDFPMKELTVEDWSG